MANILPAKETKNIPRELEFKKGIVAVVKIKKPTNSLAPDEIPRTKGPTIGFLKKVWSKYPEMDNAPPNNMADRILGSLILNRTLYSNFVNPLFPMITSFISFKFNSTEPFPRFNPIANNSIAINIIKLIIVLLFFFIIFSHLSIGFYYFISSRNSNHFLLFLHGDLLRFHVSFQLRLLPCLLIARNLFVIPKPFLLGLPSYLTYSL